MGEREGIWEKNENRLHTVCHATCELGLFCFLHSVVNCESKCVLMSAMLISTLNLPHTHSGNALVSCVCDAVDRLLIGVEESCEK